MRLSVALTSAHTHLHNDLSHSKKSNEMCLKNSRLCMFGLQTPAGGGRSTVNGGLVTSLSYQVLVAFIHNNICAVRSWRDERE